MSSTPTLNWGVLGASAKIFQGRLRPAFGLAEQPIVAEARRTSDGGMAPYDDLLARSDVDAVYIPLPNHQHAPWIHRALDAGKHVLCEKPLTMSAADTRACYEHAESVGLILSEAYMWPHSPRTQVLMSLATSGALGTLRHHHGAFSFLLDDPTNHRADERGAGALFDIGIYTLGPAVLLAQRDPVAVTAAAQRNANGADLNMTGWLDFGGGFTASFEVSFGGPHRRAQDLRGSTGGVHIAHWAAPGPEDDGTIVVERGDEPSENIRYTGANSFDRMIRNFVAVVRGDESLLWTVADSIRLADIEDRLHAATTPLN